VNLQQSCKYLFPVYDIPTFLYPVPVKLKTYQRRSSVFNTLEFIYMGFFFEKATEALLVIKREMGYNKGITDTWRKQNLGISPRGEATTIGSERLRLMKKKRTTNNAKEKTQPSSKLRKQKQRNKRTTRQTTQACNSIR
jgi:hypothetical protein